MITYTLTFGDRCENHAGMDIKGIDVGKGNGFNLDDLKKAKEFFEKLGCECEIVNLKELINLDAKILENINDAYLLIIKNMMQNISKRKDTIEIFIKEMESFIWDNKYWDKRRKKVLNKHARENVCFGDQESEPDYENGKGRIIKWDNVPILNNVKKIIELVLGNKGKNLMCEGNKYKNNDNDYKNNGGIGWHGDGERRKVFALRIGKPMVLKYNWWFKCKPVGNIFEVTLNSGDAYIMSEKAVGYDWLTKNIYTLRHSAGSNKYVKL